VNQVGFIYKIIQGCTVNRLYRDARSTDYTGMHGQQIIQGCTVNRLYRDARSIDYTGMHGQQNTTSVTFLMQKTLFRIFKEITETYNLLLIPHFINTL
jgi:hypothetical protein